MLSCMSFIHSCLFASTCPFNYTLIQDIISVLYKHRDSIPSFRLLNKDELEKYKCVWNIEFSVKVKSDSFAVTIASEIVIEVRKAHRKML